jgi:hypothetical protein
MEGLAWHVPLVVNGAATYGLHGRLEEILVRRMTGVGSGLVLFAGTDEIEQIHHETLEPIRNHVILHFGPGDCYCDQQRQQGRPLVLEVVLGSS